MPFFSASRVRAWILASAMTSRSASWSCDSCKTVASGQGYLLTMNSRGQSCYKQSEHRILAFRISSSVTRATNARAMISVARAIINHLDKQQNRPYQPDASARVPTNQSKRDRDLMTAGIEADLASQIELGSAEGLAIEPRRSQPHRRCRCADCAIICLARPPAACRGCLPVL